MMNLPVGVVAAYGIITLVGGIIGYVKAKSQASLLAGLIAGALLLFSAYGMIQEIRAAAVTALGVSILLGLRFFGTFLKKRRFFPDLLMVVLSGVTIALLATSGQLLP